MHKGTVKWYDKNKGYGFITTEDGYDIFLHHSSMIKKHLTKKLDSGNRVNFDIGSGKKGPMALHVELDDASAPHGSAATNEIKETI